MELKFNATILMQMFNFLLLLVLLRLVAYKPLLKVLEERQKYVANTIAHAENQRAEAEKIKAEYEAEMRRAREQAQAIIERATKAGEEQALNIIAQAKAEAERIKEGALADIQREREKAIAELRDQVASLALLVAGKVIKETLDVQAHERLVQDAIKEVGQLPC